MRNIDYKLSKQRLSLSSDQRDIVKTEIQHAIANLLGRKKPKDPQSPKVQQRIEAEAATVFQGIQRILTEHAPPELTGTMMEIVQNEVVRAVGLRIAGMGNLPEDIKRLKGYEHEFDLEILSSVLQPSAGKRQLAAGAIGQLITAKITTHKNLKNFLRRVLKCTDAHGAFSVEIFEKLEPYPAGAMGIETLNLLMRYLVAKKLLKATEVKKITEIKQAEKKPEKEDDDLDEEDFLPRRS